MLACKKCGISFFPTKKNLDEINESINGNISISFICPKCRGDNIFLRIYWKLREKIHRKITGIKTKWRIKHPKPKQEHNCFKHDYDGGVCLICGSVGHRERLNAALGWDDDPPWDDPYDYDPNDYL